MVTVAFTLAGDIASFDKEAFRASLLKFLGEGVENIEVTIEAGSVVVTTRVIMSSDAGAAIVSSSLSASSPAQLANLSAELNITIDEAPVVAVATQVVEAPLPPAPPRPPSQPPFSPGVFLVASTADLRDAVAHKLSSGEVGNDVFAAAAAYVAKALARDALGDFVAAHRDDSLLLASL